MDRSAFRVSNKDIILGESSDCEPLPIIRLEQSPSEEADCTKDRTSRKMHEDSSPASVRIRQSGTFGSGFFVGDGSLVVTNAHVVQGKTGPLEVDTHDYQTFRARVEKLDDVNDLAVLRLEDDVHWPATLKLGSSESLKNGDPIYALGHPFGYVPTYISPGTITAKGSLEKLFRLKLPEYRDWWHGIETIRNAAPMVEAEVHLEPGNSGGPLINPQGEVVAVSQSVFNKSAYNVPVEKVKDLLNSPDDEFAPKYGIAQRHPVLFGATSLAITAGVATAPRLGGGVMSLASAFDLYHLIRYPESAGDSYAELRRALRWTADLSIIAGTGMTWIPRLRPLGTAGLCIGLAAVIGSAFVPTQS